MRVVRAAIAAAVVTVTGCIHHRQNDAQLPDVIVAQFFGAHDLIEDLSIELWEWSPPLAWIAKVINDTEFHNIVLRGETLPGENN